ncbi:MAG: hypothetical protein JNM17_32385 [Archangium sp.]|nr:hypothetical protein [Archangium sp.]
MFANQRGATGIGSIVGVALVMALSLFGTAMMVKVYRDGGASQLPSNTDLPSIPCTVVCPQGAQTLKARAG